MNSAGAVAAVRGAGGGATPGAVRTAGGSNWINFTLYPFKVSTPKT